VKRAWAVVALFAVLEIIAAVFGPYGYFIDELYYLACARHLAWGYVDHPPFSIGVLALTNAIAGASQTAIRLPSIAAVAGAIAVTALLARRLGGGSFAAFLAALCAATSPIAIILASFYSMNAIELLLWPLAALVLLWDDPRRWIALGVVFGVGLENKHTMSTLAVALAIGIVATPMRAVIRTRGPFVAVAIAAALLAPNVIWQIAHGFPSLEFYRNAQTLKNVPTSPLKGVFNQVLVAGPGGVFVWIAGAVSLLRSKRERFLGIAFVVLFAMMIASRSSRPDRIAPFYFVLFAAGAVAIERWTEKAWARALACAPAIAIGIVLAPLGAPILAPEKASAYARALGVFPQVEKGKTSPLPQPLADRTGWPELVADVRGVVGTLDPSERANAIILCNSYGPAGALQRLGADLPPVYALQNSYWEWPPPRDPEIVIAIDVDDDRLAKLFEERTVMKVHHCPYCMSWRDGMEIVVAKKPSSRLQSEWAALKHFE
jgi:hypothetical protein